MCHIRKKQMNVDHLAATVCSKPNEANTVRLLDECGREHVVLCAMQLQSRKAWHAMDKLGVMKVRHSTAAVAECPLISGIICQSKDLKGSSGLHDCAILNGSELFSMCAPKPCIGV